MSSGFVSGGTTEQPRERNELWQKAEQELEAARQRKLEQKNHDGKSLYEVLQENKGKHIFVSYMFVLCRCLVAIDRPRFIGSEA